MITIPGYEINNQIYESINSEVYRGIRHLDQQPVIIKVLKQNYPTPQEITRYKQEYEITHNLNINGVIKAYGLELSDQTVAIILEDFGGESLKVLINEKIPKLDLKPKLNLNKFLQIAIKIADNLGHIHEANIIHKDLNPANIVFNTETGVIKIIDFGISTLLNRENHTLKNPNVLEGTLAYISPEQTGRMNRCLDYRTDFYSLGATFYELLTGQLPFNTNDAMELVHCHIAKKTIPPDQINSEIPKTVSDLVMKLMAKTAEERYQSAWGLKADLEKCLTQLESDGNILDFSLAEQDISDKFQIPQKLYGREVEVKTLLAAFERVAGKRSSQPSFTRGVLVQGDQSREGIEMMLVTGYSGIGKSALVQEIYKPITEKRGYFISGKFDQFQRNIPYSAIVRAFSILVQQLLTESEIELYQWQIKLLTALGQNAQVIIDVIPEIELIIGKQPDLLELGSQESQNRFNLVFQNFIRVFCSPEHPLVIFLDDLQWADSATLKLIELMMTDPDMQYLFLIGAYRDNEVSPTHPLMITLDGLEKAGARINSIHLDPLELEPICHLIAETLKSTPDAVKSLAELVVQKTEGNPFFVNEFLKNLHSENLLIFDFPSRSWQWDVEQIAATNITDNVVELMISKVKKLPEATQQVLHLAACIGTEFNLNTLVIVSEKSHTTLFADLLLALKGGLILATSELDFELLIQNYKFLHDRVQQAAYTLIDDDSQQAVHLKIGRLLIQNIPPDQREQRIFEIVDHLNLGKDLIGSDTERIELAKLNLTAGHKAKAATAYGVAIAYLHTGIQLLGDDSWQNFYQLSLALYEEAVEVAYICSDFERMEQWSKIVLLKAKNLLDRLKVYQTKIQTCMAQSQLIAGVKIGIQVLELLGVNLPESPTSLDIQSGLEETKALLTGKKMEELLNLPPMIDVYKLAAMRMLSSLFSPVYIAVPELLPLIPCEQVNLSLQYGNSDFSAYGYANYAAILNGVFQDIEQAYQFGNLALNLAEKLNTKALKAKIINQVAVFIIHGKEHIRKTLPLFQQAYQSGIENGDLEFAGYAAMNQSQYAYFSGLELTELTTEIANYSKALSHFKQEISFNYNQLFQQVVLNLLGQTKNPCLLSDEAYNEEKFIPLHLAANDQVALHFFYLHKIILCYLFGEISQAQENVEKFTQYINVCTGFITVPIFYFYDSLVRLVAQTSEPKSALENNLVQVKSNQEKMEKLAHHAPMNYSHKLDLVKAEIYRLQGSYVEAIEYYDRAIAGARANQYIQEEALAYELAAKFYLQWGKNTIAQIYLTEAYYNYMRWGAKAKVKHLESKYPQLLIHVTTTVRLTQSHRQASTLTRTQSGEALDLATVMKASQAISGEIVLEKLLSALMKILLENAGAELGSLIFNTAGELLIAAQGKVDVEQIIVGQLIPIDHHLPASILNYVVRTRESVVLNDASREGNFQNDSYIKANQPKSILCVPLISQGQLVSLVYLENNLMTGAFTPDRLELLKMLSSQAAIAIENAQLYANLAESNRTLEMKVAARTQELSQALDDLRTTQTELIQSEKMAALGQLIAGIAHEINTPLGAIRSSTGNISKFLTQTLEQLPILCQSLAADQVQDFLALLQRSLNHHSHLSAKEERKIKRGLVAQISAQQLKDADVLADTLVDMGIYEDIEPFTSLLQRPDATQILEIAYKLSGLQRGTQTIATATERASKVVFALKSYARYDHSGELISTQIHDSIDNVLTLYQNQIKQGVEVIKNYGDLPAIACYPDELNQVWTNIIHNALQAMDNRGTLIIQTTHSEAQVQISISDTGPGIPTEIQAKIFEPFFTTKPPGEGSGLGLDIVKKIISKHSGKITVNSEPGRTTFHILLPIQPDQELNHV